MEQGLASVAGVEVKAAASVSARDFRGLKKLEAVSGDRFTAGVILYDGEQIAAFSERLFAVPIRMLWEM